MSRGDEGPRGFEDPSVNKDESLRNLRLDEQSRRPGAQRSAAKEKARRLHEMETLLTRGTEEDVVAVIRAAGMEPSSPEGQQVLKTWRENQY